MDSIRAYPHNITFTISFAIGFYEPTSYSNCLETLVQRPGELIYNCIGCKFTLFIGIGIIKVVVPYFRYITFRSLFNHPGSCLIFHLFFMLSTKHLCIIGKLVFLYPRTPKEIEQIKAATTAPITVPSNIPNSNLISLDTISLFPPTDITTHNLMKNSFNSR